MGDSRDTGTDYQLLNSRWASCNEMTRLAGGGIIRPDACTDACKFACRCLIAYYYSSVKLAKKLPTYLPTFGA